MSDIFDNSNGHGNGSDDYHNHGKIVMDTGAAISFVSM